MKKCSECGELKSGDLFYKDKNAKDGKRNLCIPCAKRVWKKYREDNPEKVKKWTRDRYYKDIEKSREYGRNCQIKTLYGISIDEFNKLVSEQSGKCFICDRKPNRLYIDHCHKTKNIRKLLCQQCNSGIGMFGENIETMMKAIQYIRTYNG